MMRLPTRHDICIFTVLVICSVLLCLIPPPPQVAKTTGFKTGGRVMETDDSSVERHDLVLFGSQRLKVRINSGKFKGTIVNASNELRAQLELDKLFKVGDRVVLTYENDDIDENSTLIARDYDRSFWSVLLFSLFCILLCLFAGWTGFNALLSFIFSCLVIWKAVIPLSLRGWPASWTFFGAVFLLTAVIMYLVAGFNKRGVCAFLGAIAGVFIGLFTAHFFTWVMNINGATMPYSQTLLFTGYGFLDLRDVFAGAMILASSGAVMDLGMDISCGIEEVARHNPTLSRMELTKSGLRMGRSVVGTMTTTLLLAYSGGYITLLMMFCAQGQSPMDFINNPLVASEAVKTLVGSFSLVLVAPLTAFLGGFIFKR